MLFVLALILGVLPSLVWLLYYLKSDVHPEPKSIILEVFILGMISGGAAIGFQYLLIYIGNSINYQLKELIGLIVPFPILMIIGWAWIEEYVKYLVAKIRVLHDAAFDEPTDAMIYLICAGLGFAAIENILFVMPMIFDGGISGALQFLVLRFFTATLLHALASGIIGFFFALAIIYHTRSLLFLGFVIGVVLHTIYNYSIMIPEEGINPYLLLLVLFVGIVFIKIGFFNLRSRRF